MSGSGTAHFLEGFTVKVLLFLMGNPDSFEMASPLVHTLRRADVDVTISQYSSEEVVPLDELVQTGARYLPLTDGGFESIPRLSTSQYRALCGDDIDFAGCQYHNLSRHDFPTT